MSLRNPVLPDASDLRALKPGQIHGVFAMHGTRMSMPTPTSLLPITNRGPNSPCVGPGNGRDEFEVCSDPPQRRPCQTADHPHQPTRVGVAPSNGGSLLRPITRRGGPTGSRGRGASWDDLLGLDSADRSGLGLLKGSSSTCAGSPGGAARDGAAARIVVTESQEEPGSWWLGGLGQAECEQQEHGRGLRAAKISPPAGAEEVVVWPGGGRQRFPATNGVAASVSSLSERHHNPILDWDHSSGWSGLAHSAARRRSTAQR
ncbi:hypothetical protein NDU88_005000 [Pleurodeles waltl]|uniref:Uncharacterized protein n=1 Tax=Pleurodeles waltl TaxID=8319 RepID=A0AAV7MV18_PLEWA|nr:hypothetical protein NDU88_005000 [Pleurodeles waltl]